VVLRADADDRRDVDGVSACHAEALSKVYGADPTAVHALRDVTLDIPRGSFTAIMGPSGSGKSTLLHCLAALDTPTSGRVFLGDTELTALSRRRQARVRRDRIGFVFQAYNLVPTLDALENITLPQLLAGRSPDHEWLDHVISRMGLGDRIHHRPNELSGGQQQRIALARALAGRPEVIFADEPTGNLDTAASGEMLTLLRDAVDQFAQTVVTVTHDPSVARYADQILQFSDGRVVDRHDRRAVGQGSVPNDASDVAGSGGPDQHLATDTPPRPDGQHTMRRRRRQPGEPTPGRPMVGSDDEVEVTRQERWLQRIREQFETELDADTAFDAGPLGTGEPWDDASAEQPLTRPPSGHADRGAQRYAPPERADAHDPGAPLEQETPRAADDTHVRGGYDGADRPRSRPRFRTPPQPPPMPYTNGVTANGARRDPVERYRDHDHAARNGASAVWDDRGADAVAPARNDRWDATGHAVDPIDGEWLPPMRSSDHHDGAPTDDYRDPAQDTRPWSGTDHHDDPADEHRDADRYSAPADDHRYGAPTDTHRQTDHYDTPADDKYGPAADMYAASADDPPRPAAGGHRADRYDEPADAGSTVDDLDPDAARDAAPLPPPERIDPPWSRPDDRPPEAPDHGGRSSGQPVEEIDDPWAPPDARKAEEYRTGQGTIRRGPGWSVHDSGDIWATARFDRDAVDAEPSAAHDPDMGSDGPSPATEDRPFEPVDDGSPLADEPVEASGGASPALTELPAEPDEEILPALAASSSAAAAAETADPGDSVEEPDDYQDPAVHDPSPPGEDADAIGPLNRPPTADDSTQSDGAPPRIDATHRPPAWWDTDDDTAVDEVWTPTFERSWPFADDVADTASDPVRPPVNDDDAGWSPSDPIGSAAPRHDTDERDDAEPPERRARTWDRPDAPTDRGSSRRAGVDDADRVQHDAGTHVAWSHQHVAPTAEPDHPATDDAPPPATDDQRDDTPPATDDQRDDAPAPVADDPWRDPEPSPRPAANEPPVPAALASLRNTRRADQADDARAALQSLQQQLDRLASRRASGSPRQGTGPPRGADRRPPD
jgi:putative ABC transport system ATP-binding protein